MVHVAGFGHAHHRVQQQHPVHFLGRPLGQLLVYTMQRVAGLEGDHIAPAELLKPCARLGRRQA